MKTPEELARENSLLRRIVRDYARHNRDCAIWDHEICSCGWEDVMKSLRKLYGK